MEPDKFGEFASKTSLCLKARYYSKGDDPPGAITGGNEISA